MSKTKGENLLYEDLTYQIRGACFDVWKEFRGGFKESVVDKALSIELEKRGLTVENQKRIDIYYDSKKVGTYIPDKVINSKIIIELKSKPYLSEEDERQFWKYLMGSNYKLGMLINFGSKGLEIKRRIYDKARCKQPFRADQRSNQRVSASKGFTLVEMLVYTFIFALLFLTISGIMFWFTFSSAVEKADREVLENSKNAMEWMIYEIKRAEAVYTPTTPGIPTTPGSQLSLKTYNYIPEGETSSFIDFYLCGSRICFKKEAQDPAFLTPENINVTDLNFTMISTDGSESVRSVRINLSSEYAGAWGGPAFVSSVDLDSTASLRTY